MRLKQIKLAGFKSFVDATKIPFLNSLTAVIGPNGCGKSNVIDAVRWVLGESSAKHLRGDSMMDVIFNGSTARRPISVASVELLFENNYGRLGGEYASYSEISVKRQISRDGDAAYFLNGQKCRRKDITELFMGTGLGARSYAIIGQGTISRLIESKPQELRVFIEEAAGISRYKERRRDTENRIRHTRENLERLGDIRGELGNQLEKLAAQATAAKKYRELKQQERRCHGELLAVRYQDLIAQSTTLSSQIIEQELQLAKAESMHEKGLLELTTIQSKLESLSDAEHNERNAYYEANTQIAKLEQQLQAIEARQTQTQEALAELAVKIDSANQHRTEAEVSGNKLQSESQGLTQQIELRESEIKQKKAILEQAQDTVKKGKQQLDEQSRVVTEYRHSVMLLSKQLEHVTATEVRSNSQCARDVLALDGIESSSATTIKQELALLIQQLDDLSLDAEVQAERQLAYEEELEVSQASLSQADEALQDCQQQRAGLIARAEVLDELQSNSSGESEKLWQHLTVDKGWEIASQLLLGSSIHFPVSSDKVLNKETPLGFEPDYAIDTSTEAKDTNSAPLSSLLNIQPWLNGLHWVKDLASAEALLADIAINERIVTADGYLLGHGFKLTQLDEEPALLAFNEERQQLVYSLQSLDEKIALLQRQKHDLQGLCQQISASSLASRQLLAQAKASQAELNLTLSAKQHQEALKQQVNDLNQRINAVKQELGQIGADKTEIAAQVDSKQKQLNDALQNESVLKASSKQAEQTLDSVSRDYYQVKQALEKLGSQLGPMHTQIALNQQTCRQLDVSLNEYYLQKTRLDTAFDSLDSNASQQSELPNISLQQELEKQLGIRQAKQVRLDENHQQQVALQEQVDNLGTNRKQQLAKNDALNQTISELKLRREGVKGQANSQKLALQEEGVATEVLDDGSLKAKSEQQRQTELDGIRRAVARLGAINLAAIEEYDQQSERKRYLDEQDDDLNKALQSLEDAIRKIDRETRTRFKQTFDQVNHDLGLLFPKVFGGGSAYLAMTDDDLLDTGVTIMARPPGKKNSTIHLLSGGEKALTALSLVFAIFRLNPAPFCMLDEVDAPLDDANVERFCRLLKEMSQSVQFIYISHNKITMEMADQLIGVTMHEPGVSRIVAVDIDEAVALADAG